MNESLSNPSREGRSPFFDYFYDSPYLLIRVSPSLSMDDKDDEYKSFGAGARNLMMIVLMMRIFSRVPPRFKRMTDKTI